jgi:hypothetical protein
VNTVTAIPFQNTDRHYLAKLDNAANEVRERIKILKLLIASNDGAESPAFAWAQAEHDRFKQVCSLTCKAIRAAKVRPVGEGSVSL